MTLPDPTITRNAFGYILVLLQLGASPDVESALLFLGLPQTANELLLLSSLTSP